MTPLVVGHPGSSRPFELVGIEAETHLRGLPAPGATREDRASGQVTGGGFAAHIEARRGLRGLWQDATPLLGSWEVGVRDSMGSPLPTFRWGEGRWSGEHSLGAQGTILECGVLLDDPPAVVLEWCLASNLPRREAERQPPVSLLVRFVGPDNGPIAELSLPLSAGAPATCCLLGSEADPGTSIARLRSLSARERQRVRRSSDEGEHPLRIQIDGETAFELEAAQHMLSDVELAPTYRAEPPGRFLGGFSDGVPSYFAGTRLVELGLGALASGRFALSRRILEQAAHDQTTPAAALLFLAARHAMWTGRPQSLTSILERLTHAAERAEPIGRSDTFPSPETSVSLLIRALQPLGRHPSILLLEDELARLAHTSSAGRRRLPVLREGAPLERGEATPSRNPTLPPIAAFAHPHETPLGRRVLHSARLIRSWVERELGAEADAAYGRLQLAPEIDPSWERLNVKGLRVGDATVRFEHVREGSSHAFHLVQESGRLPLNIVFSPRLPVQSVLGVEIGNAPADVALSSDAGGTRVECQFPLDPSRDIRVATG